MTMGRMFVAADPGGAAFGVWQAGDSIGATHINEPGGLAWEDLFVPDPDSARAFYGAVFGFVYEELPDAPTDYQLFKRPDEPWPLGGMGSLAEGAYPAWLPYFSVRDTDRAVEAARTTVAARAAGAGQRVRHGRRCWPTGRRGVLGDPGDPRRAPDR